MFFIRSKRIAEIPLPGCVSTHSEKQLKYKNLQLGAGTVFWLTAFKDTLEIGQREFDYNVYVAPGALVYPDPENTNFNGVPQEPVHKTFLALVPDQNSFGDFITALEDSDRGGPFSANRVTMGFNAYLQSPILTFPGPSIQGEVNFKKIGDSQPSIRAVLIIESSVIDQQESE